MMRFCHAQRSMRALKEAAMQRGVIALLDIGTTKTVCLIVQFDNRSKVTSLHAGVRPIAGHSGFKVIGADITQSRGMRLGEIYSVPETERAIRTVVTKAQKMAGVRADHVIATLSGGAPRSYGVDGQIALENETVTNEDIGRLLSSCDVPNFGADRMVLHAQPVNFGLDHRANLGDPRGQSGDVLSTDLHMLTIDDQVLHTVSHCIKGCDMELAGLASSAYVSGLSTLMEDEQELGAAVIDLGGGSTGISVFYKKHMIYADSVRIGGNHITGDISLGLHVSEQVAERMKTLNGDVMATGIDARDLIEVTGHTGDWERDRRRISRSELIGIIRPRVEEILEEVRSRLDAAYFDHLPGGQIVLTGGGSNLPGIVSLAQKILGRNVRLGRPVRVQGMPLSTTGPAFSAAVGLTQFTATPQDEWWDFEVPTANFNGRPLRRAMQWFKSNW